MCDWGSALTRELAECQPRWKQQFADGKTADMQCFGGTKRIKQANQLMPISKGWRCIFLIFFVTYLISPQTLMNILQPTANARWPGVKPGRTIQGMSTAIGEGVIALDFW